MEITQTAQYNDAIDIMTNGDSGATVRWSMEITNGDDVIVYPLWINHVFNRKDGVIGFADELQVSFNIGAGAYTRKLLPFRDLLSVRLIRVDVETSESTEDNLDFINFDLDIPEEAPDNEKRCEMVYTGIIMDTGQNPSVAQGREDDGEDVLDLSAILEVRMQLFNPILEQIKGIEIGGIIRDSTIHDIIANYFTMAKEELNTDEKVVIENINIAKINNSEPLSQVIIPHNLPVYELPRYLQQNYGVYSAGCGTYIDNTNWNVYPIYNTDKFDDAKQKVTVYIMPRKKFQFIEHTYKRNDDGSSSIVCTGETGFKDDSGSQYLKYGNGAKYVEVENLAEGAKSSNNKAIYSKATNSVSVTNETRRNDVNISKSSSSKITANPYQVYSQLASRSGNLLKFIWQSSCFDLIYVGQPIKVLYCDGDEIKSLVGVIAYIGHLSQNVSGAANDRWVNQSIVQAFVREEELDNPSDKTEEELADDDIDSGEDDTVT